MVNETPAVVEGFPSGVSGPALCTLMPKCVAGCGGAGGKAVLLMRMETSFFAKLTRARSDFPSPLKSPTAIPRGEEAGSEAIVEIDVKLPAASFIRELKVLSLKLATARSTSPSPLKSPEAAAIGDGEPLLPTTKGLPPAGVKFPPLSAR